ncbi:MAG: hypothetical protein ACM3UP_00590 [Methanocella sp.]
MGKEKQGIPASIIRDMGQFPQLPASQWSFCRGDQVFTLNYRPLSYEDQEAIDAMFPPPVPPLKEVTDEKERLKRAALKMPLAEPDSEDPEYKRQVSQYQVQRSLAHVWKALGWELGFDEFASTLKQKLTPAELLDFARTVTLASYHIDQERVKSFFAS